MKFSVDSARDVSEIFGLFPSAVNSAPKKFYSLIAQGWAVQMVRALMKY